MKLSTFKIITAGQTRSEREALDGARLLGIPVAGVSPVSGSLKVASGPAANPSDEIDTDLWKRSLEENVSTSDGTLFFVKASSHNILDLPALVTRYSKPILVIQSLQEWYDSVAFREWMRRHHILKLHVTGAPEAPRKNATEYRAVTDYLVRGFQTWVSLDTDGIVTVAPREPQRSATGDPLTDALFEATEDGDVERARALLSSGADVNARKGYMTVLSTAVLDAPWYAGLRAREMVRFLLDHGADPNLPMEVEEPGTPIFDAIIHGDPVVVEMLLDSGADPNVVWNFGTALGSADADLFYHQIEFRANVDVEPSRARSEGR